MAFPLGNWLATPVQRRGSCNYLCEPGWMKLAGPHVAGISPEHSRFNESLKADALRRLLRTFLLAGTAGAGTGLLSNYLGRKSIAVPESDMPDVDLPYPQLAASSPTPELVKRANAAIARLVAYPTVGAGIGAAYGATRNYDDPVAGGLYGGVRGLGEGAGAGLGAVGGSALGQHLAERLAGQSRHAGKIGAAGSWLGMLLGGGLGGLTGHAATSGLMHHTVGPPPWHKKADWADSTAHAVMPTPVGEPMPTVFSPRWLRGDSQHSIGAMPWVYPAAAAAGFGGAWAGNALTRHLLKKRHKAQLDAEVAAAKKEYEEAMMGQYDPGKIHQLAGEKGASAINQLDVLHDKLEKVGFDVNALLGHGAGGALTMAAALAGLTGVGTYKFLHSRSKSKLLADALKRRAMIRGMAQPADVYLHPVPAHYHHGRIHEDTPVDPLRSMPV